jgi:hypothetical protein
MKTFTANELRHGTVCALSASLTWLALLLLAATIWGTLSRSPGLALLWVVATLVWFPCVIAMLRVKRGVKEWIILIVGGVPCLILIPFLVSGVLFSLNQK